MAHHYNRCFQAWFVLFADATKVNYSPCSRKAFTGFTVSVSLHAELNCTFACSTFYMSATMTSSTKCCWYQSLVWPGEMERLGAVGGDVEMLVVRIHGSDELQHGTRVVNGAESRGDTGESDVLLPLPPPDLHDGHIEVAYLKMDGNRVENGFNEQRHQHFSRHFDSETPPIFRRYVVHHDVHMKDTGGKNNGHRFEENPLNGHISGQATIAWVTQAGLDFRTWRVGWPSATAAAGSAEFSQPLVSERHGQSLYDVHNSAADAEANEEREAFDPSLESAENHRRATIQDSYDGVCVARMTDVIWEVDGALARN